MLALSVVVETASVDVVESNANVVGSSLVVTAVVESMPDVEGKTLSCSCVEDTNGRGVDNLTMSVAGASVVVEAARSCTSVVDECHAALVGGCDDA